MDLDLKYQRLWEKSASPKSLDVGRATIFSFEKYCKHCAQGMFKPPRHELRARKALWSKGFCGEKCKALGKRDPLLSSVTVKAGAPNHKNEHTVEEMAFISLELQKRDKVAHPAVKLVLRAIASFRLLSERLAFLESFTGEGWTSSKFYYWAGKI
jgi:hypothetical protein